MSLSNVGSLFLVIYLPLGVAAASFILSRISSTVVEINFYTCSSLFHISHHLLKTGWRKTERHFLLRITPLFLESFPLNLRLKLCEQREQYVGLSLTIFWLSILLCRLYPSAGVLYYNYASFMHNGRKNSTCCGSSVLGVERRSVLVCRYFNVTNFKFICETEQNPENVRQRATS